MPPVGVRISVGVVGCDTVRRTLRAQPARRGYHCTRRYTAYPRGGHHRGQYRAFGKRHPRLRRQSAFGNHGHRLRDNRYPPFGQRRKHGFLCASRGDARGCRIRGDAVFHGAYRQYVARTAIPAVTACRAAAGKAVPAENDSRSGGRTDGCHIATICQKPHVSAYPASAEHHRTRFLVRHGIVLFIHNGLPRPRRGYRGICHSRGNAHYRFCLSALRQEIVLLHLCLSIRRIAAGGGQVREIQTASPPQDAALFGYISTSALGGTDVLYMERRVEPLDGL